MGAVERHRRLGPQPAQHLDLFLGASAPIPEVLAERLVFDCVPTQSDAEPELATGEQVDLGGLFGHQRGLPLRQDDHPGDQFEVRQPGKESEQDERFVEGGVDVIRSLPTLVHVGVGAEHMVVDQDVGVAEFFDALPVRPGRSNGRRRVRSGMSPDAHGVCNLAGSPNFRQQNPRRRDRRH